MPDIVHAAPDHPAIYYIRQLNDAYMHLSRTEARIHHFKMNFEEQRQTLLERVRHANNMAHVDESIETFFEKVFDEPFFKGGRAG